MIICPNPTCGAQNDDAGSYCDQCGTSLAGAPRGGPPAAAAPVYGGAPPAGGASTCPNCGAAFIPGEPFCSECGAALSGPAPAAPAAAGYGAPAYAPPPAAAPAYVPPPAPAYAPPPAASARLMAAGHTYPLAGKSAYLIGRTDDVSGIYPEVDTSTTGGMENGVGRKHAEISLQGYQWFIKDLNSVNGTFVNNQRLAPNASQPLNPGDQIRLGRWSASFQA